MQFKWYTGANYYLVQGNNGEKTYSTHSVTCYHLMFQKEGTRCSPTLGFLYTAIITPCVIVSRGDPLELAMYRSSFCRCSQICTCSCEIDINVLYRSSQCEHSHSYVEECISKIFHLSSLIHICREQFLCGI